MIFKVRYIFGLLLLLTLLACVDNSADSVAEQTQFFDLKTYFEKEYPRLEQVKKVVKKAVVDGVEEQKTVDAINFKEELALFVDSDINKISWLDRYVVDSLFADQQLQQLTYQAKDVNLKTNRLVVSFQNEKVSKIEIFRKTESIAATLEQQLIYQPDSGYSIESKQQTSFSKPYVLALDVQFVP